MEYNIEMIKKYVLLNLFVYEIRMLPSFALIINILITYPI